MPEKILITGGAGFIGSHLADELLEAGYGVRVLDSLCGQVHGDGCVRPEYLSDEVELIQGDIRHAEAVSFALQGIDAVVHFAASVGVGQSMYQVKDYTEVNDYGTAVLLQALIENPVRRLVVASSMSVYGEGLYLDRDGRPVENAWRDPRQLEQDRWEPRDAYGRPLAPSPTPESKRANLNSVYALNKYAQEQLCMLVGKSYGLDPVALRFFNVYGTRQSLSNPYTGVLAIFASRLLNDNPPVVFEDGEQLRDFVHVKDAVRAARSALESPAAPGEIFNIGSGDIYSVSFLARKLAEVMEKDIEPQITNNYRVGDIRHCFADIGKAESMLKFKPKVKLDEGLAELISWLREQTAVDRFDAMAGELARRRLTI